MRVRIAIYGRFLMVVLIISCGMRATAQAVNGRDKSEEQLPVVVELDLPRLGPKQSLLEAPELSVIRLKAGDGTICPFVDGYHDPRRIRYNEQRFWRHVSDCNPEWILCGVAPFKMQTSQAQISVAADFTMPDFGSNFHFQHCIDFLKARPGRENAETKYIARGLDKNTKIRQPKWSPWEGDVMRVIKLLTDAKVKESAPAVLALTRDPCAEIRYSAVAGLGILGASDEHVLAALVDAMSSDDKRMVALAEFAIARIGTPAIEVLISTLRHESPSARKAAATALGKIGPSAIGAAPALTNVFQLATGEEKEAAARALQQIGAFPERAPQ